MSYSVEGPWRHFTFKTIEKEDIPKVQEHIRNNFLRDERTCELLGFTEEFGDDFGQVYESALALDEKLSFMAIDNNNGKVAAVRVTIRQDKDVNYFAQFHFRSHGTKQILKTFAHLEEKETVFDHYGVSTLAFFFTASTDKEYRNQGLATEMYKRSFALLRDRNFQVIKCIFTSPYSRKASDNFHFEEMSSVHYKGFKDENGEEMFPSAEEADYASLRCLKL